MGSVREMHYDEKKLVLLLSLFLTISFFFGCNNDSSVYYIQSEKQLEHLISDVRHKQEIEVLKIDGITEIPREVFKNCSKLQELILGNSMRLHDLRHTVVTYMLDAGENPRTVQEFVGHSDPGFMLRQYAHVLEKSKKEASEALMQNLFANGILSKNGSRK